jgi:hypothetical protein
MWAAMLFIYLHFQIVQRMKPRKLGLIIQSSMGSIIPLSEMIDMHATFLQKSYPEDIIEDIRKMADVLIKLAQTNGNEVALWALTYLFDDQDLIHDDISYLGWQDDWVVLDSAMRILHLN